MKRALAVIRASVLLILAIAGIVFVVGLSSPESRWNGRSLVILGFCSLFLAYCVWVLVAAFRKRPAE